MSSTNQQYLNEYVDIFSKSCSLFLKLKKDASASPRQVQEIKEIYQKAYIGMLRAGYERKIVEKNGEDFIQIKVTIDGIEKELNFNCNSVRKELGDEYESVINNTNSISQQVNTPSDSVKDFMNEQPQQDFRTEEEVPETEPENNIEEEVKPTSIQEGDSRNKNNFCYEEFKVVAQNVKDGTIKNISLFLYPDIVPQTREDKIQIIGVAKDHSENKNIMAISKEGGSAVLTFGTLGLMVKFKPGKNNSFEGEIHIVKGKTEYYVDIESVKKSNTTYGYNGSSHYVNNFKGKELHIFPLNFNDNDLEGCVSVVAYAGEEKQIICPHETKYLPVSIGDNRYNLQLYWRGDILHCEQVD